MKIYEGLKGKEEILRGWISLRTGMEFPIEWIPETGLEVVDDGKTLCYLVVYFEKTCPVAYIGWIVSNPENTLKESADGIAFGIGAVAGYAKRLGARHLLTTTGNERINEIYTRRGFIGGDERVQHKYLYIGG